MRGLTPPQPPHLMTPRPLLSLGLVTLGLCSLHAWTPGHVTQVQVRNRAANEISRNFAICGEGPY